MLLCSAQRRWLRCDKQQAAVFYFPFSICYFFVVVYVAVVAVVVVAANPRKNYILTFVRG